MANNWSRLEVEATVEDYFDMLRLELTRRPCNKTKHRRALRARLNQRSDGSVELKHQNISAVLIKLGIPYVQGYKPRFNYQHLLLEVVADYIAAHPELRDLFRADADSVPPVPTVEDFLAAMVEPPRTEPQAPLSIAEPAAVYVPGGKDYLEIEARNQWLGDAGECFIINFERARLIHAGQDALADRIEQVSVTEGPAAGFDIRSFEEDGSDRFIEAKTTKYGKHTPFFVTPNELRFSERHARRYYLYRLFSFRADPRLFALQGELQTNFQLTPSEYVAKFQ
ncbi:MAG: DUF3883 domain-containing protein [Pseudomonadota bacterium]